MEKNEMIRLALLKACKYLREHPPADAAWSGDMRDIQCIVDAKGDPEGYRWLARFLDEVKEEYK